MLGGRVGKGFEKVGGRVCGQQTSQQLEMVSLDLPTQLLGQARKKGIHRLESRKEPRKVKEAFL